MSLSDLEQVASLGFRGEALASIATIARVQLTSQSAGADHAWSIQVEGGQAGEPSPAARSTGTTIDIQDLFFNTPARRKVLKTEATEYAHCAETVRRLALAQPQVAFTLTHNGRVQLRLNAEPAAMRVRHVLGDSFEQNTVAVDAAAGLLRVSGWVIRPGASYGPPAWPGRVRQWPLRARQANRARIEGSLPRCAAPSAHSGVLPVHRPSRSITASSSATSR